MIKIYRAKKESRVRDKKRDRFILQLGKRKYHITPEEAIGLLNHLKGFLTKDG